LKALIVVLALTLCTSACMTGGAQTKQTVTVNILQPTHDALAAFQDLEIALFRGNEIPQLTPQLHMQIEAKLAIAFRSHATAARAVRTWQPGQPVPIDVNQLQADVLSVQGLLHTAGISDLTLLGQKAGAMVGEAQSVVRQLGGQ
jgi:hypothetical protein